jgi:hypothetical protein
MTYPSETMTAKQYSTAVAAKGSLLVSLVSVAHSFVHLRIGTVGARNLEVERLNLGEFVQSRAPTGRFTRSVFLPWRGATRRH